jgi:hypothetical protein
MGSTWIQYDPITEIGTSLMGNVPLYLDYLANLEQPVAAGS